MSLKDKFRSEPAAIPGYPPRHLLQRIANNPDQEDFIRSFGHLRFEVKNYLRQAGLQFSQFKEILDFGCGVGRFAFSFKDELTATQRLWGCDIYEECAHWCRDNIDFGNFQHTSVVPPLPYPDGQFDFIYALSVFTHLELDQQFRWAWELHRVLKPGGIVFATIHGPLFIPLFFQTYLDNAQSRTIHSLGERGLFAYMSYSGKVEDVGQSTVAAAQTPEFVEHQFSAFELVKMFPQSNLAGEQDLYIFRKPNHARQMAMPLNVDGKPNEQCSWTGQVATSTSDTVVSLRFDLRGHQWFRVYPRAVVQASQPLDWDVEIAGTDGASLVRRRFPFNKQRLFGPSHYGVVEVELPEYHGEVVVNLRCEVRENAGEPAGPMEMEWNFPNCV